MKDSVVVRPRARVTRWQVICIIAASLLVGAIMLSSWANADEKGNSKPFPEESLFDTVSDFFSGAANSVTTKAEKAVEDTKVGLGFKVSQEDAFRMDKEFLDLSQRVFDEKLTNVIKDSKTIDCMRRALVFEAGGEPLLGKQWVLWSIKNRLDMKYRGKTNYCDIIFDKKQYSFANYDPDRSPEYSKDLVDSEAAVEEFFSKDTEDITDCTTHYVRTDSTDGVEWAELALAGKSPKGEPLELKAIIGDHSFFGFPRDECERRKGKALAD